MLRGIHREHPTSQSEPIVLGDSECGAYFQSNVKAHSALSGSDLDFGFNGLSGVKILTPARLSA